jgi:hypothetical protein
VVKLKSTVVKVTHRKDTDITANAEVVTVPTVASNSGESAESNGSKITNMGVLCNETIPRNHLRHLPSTLLKQ